MRLPRTLSTLALSGAVLLGTASAATAVAAPQPAAPNKLVHQSGYGTVTAQCPSGYYATGGGVAVDHDRQVATLHSRPMMNGRGWEGRAFGEVQMSAQQMAEVEKKQTQQTEQAGNVQRGSESAVQQRRTSPLTTAELADMAKVASMTRQQQDEQRARQAERTQQAPQAQQEEAAADAAKVQGLPISVYAVCAKG